MKNHLFKLLILAVPILSSTINAQTKQESDSIIIEGLYNGKNILVKNSYGAGGIGFCVNGVKLNGKYTRDEINANIFAIRLTDYKLKQGENVLVKITYSKNCSPLVKPLVLNPGALINLKSKVAETVFTLEGKFQWQNLFISNAKLNNGKGFGLKEIIINGKTTISNLNTELIEINLTKMGIDEKWEDGKPLKIEFKYIQGADPVIINPEAIN